MKKILLRGPYIPPHSSNRMSSEGDLGNARERFFQTRFRNLDALLRLRYQWMNEYLREGQNIIELGAGAGFSELYLNYKPTLTDAVKNPWIDRILDATNMHLEDASVDCLIASHNIHHFYSPYKFFAECVRVLKPNGIVLIQELNTCLMLRFLLRLMRHEGWSYEVDVFNANAIANDPKDPWSANCAVPELLFENEAKFHQTFTHLKIERNSLSECLAFPLSGGVIAKTPMPELPYWLLSIVQSFDTAATTIAPSIFAMGRSVVLRRV